MSFCTNIAFKVNNVSVLVLLFPLTGSNRSSTATNRGEPGRHRVKSYLLRHKPGRYRPNTGANRGKINAPVYPGLSRCRPGSPRWRYGLPRCRPGLSRFLTLVPVRPGSVKHFKTTGKTSRFTPVRPVCPRCRYGSTPVRPGLSNRGELGS